MCSKRILLSAMLVVLGACGLKVGEKAPPTKEMTFSSDQFACVGQIGKKAELYVNASMSDADITTFITCLQSAFRDFNGKMRGVKNRDSFTPDEIRDFIHKLLPSDSPRISDPLLSQFMLIKQNLVGGPVDSITREDLEAAIQILDLIRREAIRMRPFVPILNPRLVEKEKDIATLGDRIAKAEAAASITGSVFGRILSKSQKPYSFKDFENWLYEFRHFLKWEQHFPGGHTAKEWMRLVAAFKATAVSPGNEQIVGSDWGPLFQYGVQWYLSYIKFDVGIKKQTELFDGVGLQNLIGWGDSLFALVDQAIIRQKGLIKYETANELLAALEGVNWLPPKIRASSLQSALKVIADRILGPQSVNACVRTSPGITSFVVSGLKNEFDLWKENQLALEDMFRDIENRPEKLKSVEGTLPALQPQTTTMDEVKTREAWDRFIDKYRGKEPLFKNNEPRVYLASPSMKIENGFYNLSKMNMFRAFMDLFFKGYATHVSNDIMESTLSTDQLQMLYLDFRDLGEDLGYIDKRVPNAGRRTFLEAKLFTRDADGVSEQHPNISFFQAMQEAAFLYSGGDLGTELYERLEKICGDDGPPDQMNKDTMLPRWCVRLNLIWVLEESLISKSDGKTSSMPGLSRFLAKLNRDQRFVYADTLLKAAFSKRNLALDSNLLNYAERTEMSTIAVVAQYAESVLTRYDIFPEDQTLTEKEVNVALRVFEGLAKNTVPENFKTFAKKWLPLLDLNLIAEHGFKFVLSEGRSPESALDYTLLVAHWTNDIPRWNLKVDHQGLTQVFASLIQKISDSTSSASQNARPPCK